MNPAIISCVEPDWQNVAASNLKEGIEVDLVKFNYSFDVEDCKKLAVANGMTFSFKPETEFGFFRKRQSPETR
jgi:hypothetical protein